MSAATVRRAHRVQPARLFGYVSGLAIWNASWDEAVRLTAIAVLAVVYTYTFRPREPKR